MIGFYVSHTIERLTCSACFLLARFNPVRRADFLAEVVKPRSSQGVLGYLLRSDYYRLGFRSRGVPG